MKTLSLSLLILLVSCGEPLRFEAPEISNSFNSDVYWPEKELPVTIKVPKEKFEKFKKIFSEVEKEYVDAAGRPEEKKLIEFKSDDNNYTLDNFSESKNIGSSNFLMFKEDDQNFLDVIQPTQGITQVLWHIPSMIIYRAHIVINFDQGEMEPNLFKEVLLHEIGHFLGFGHVEKNIVSIMRENIILPLEGLRDFDKKLIKKKYSIKNNIRPWLTTKL